MYGVPAQLVPVHVSAAVHGLLSSQAPEPDATAQLPASQYGVPHPAPLMVHMNVPTQAPVPSQWSPLVQLLLSLHELPAAESGVLQAPVAWSQTPAS
jgi:hypothetical protein